MSGSLLHGSWEISWAPEKLSGGAEKVNDHNAAIHAHEKSDACVVPEKQANKGQADQTAWPAELVEGRRAANGNAEQTPARRTLSREDRKRASMGLQGVRERARRDKRARFSALLHHITPQLLEQSFYALRRGAATGVDGVTWQDYEQDLSARLQRLHVAVHKGSYRAQASRRVFIPKSDGKQRALGIAAIEDKVVQQAVSTVLNAIYECDFLGFSYGFRAGRSQHQALDALWVALTSRRIEWILDADIQAFFDSIDHGWMRRFLEHRIGDQRLLRLIDKWLKAGVWEDGKRVPAQQGTPQGGVISPLLANVYLHYVFDLWVQQWRVRSARGQMIVVRYADDNIVGFEHEAQARQFLEALQDRLQKFGLQLHPGKTRLLAFGRRTHQRQNALKGRNAQDKANFDFLGFTHLMDQTRKGYFSVKRLTIKKRMRATLAAIRETLMKQRHRSVPSVGRWLKAVMRGYFNYHAVPGNIKRLDGFRSEVCRAWRRALLRRGQKSRLTWQRFNRLTRRYVPSARVVHPMPYQRFSR